VYYVFIMVRAERTILYHKINKRFIFRTVQNFPEKISEFFGASCCFSGLSSIL